jgi:hypothetical protein
VINDGMGSSLRNHKQNPIQTPALPQIFKCDSPGAGAGFTIRAGAPLRFNAGRPQAAGVVVAAPGLHGALMRGLVPQGERPA